MGSLLILEKMAGKNGGVSGRACAVRHVHSAADGLVTQSCPTDTPHTPVPLKHPLLLPFLPRKLHIVL